MKNITYIAPATCTYFSKDVFFWFMLLCFELTRTVNISKKNLGKNFKIEITTIIILF